EELERETVRWCREMLALSPLALRLLKASFNAAEDGLTGLQQLSHDATLLFYMSEEGQEGRNAYTEGRRPDFTKFPKRPSADEAVAHGGAAGPAARGDRAGARRHGGGGRGLVRHPLGRVHRSPDRERVHPDRDQPRQRLLGREARRRHRRPA